MIRFLCVYFACLFVAKTAHCGAIFVSAEYRLYALTWRIKLFWVQWTSASSSQVMDSAMYSARHQAMNPEIEWWMGRGSHLAWSRIMSWGFRRPFDFPGVTLLHFQSLRLLDFCIFVLSGFWIFFSFRALDRSELETYGLSTENVKVLDSRTSTLDVSKLSNSDIQIFRLSDFHTFGFMKLSGFQNIRFWDFRNSEISRLSYSWSLRLSDFRATWCLLEWKRRCQLPTRGISSC